MDADTIRLILTVMGALFILALYLWERAHDSDDTETDDEDEEDDDAPYGVASQRREPRLGSTGEGARGATRVWPRPAPKVEIPPSVETSVGRPARAETGSADQPEPLLIQMSVSARQAPFNGTALMEVAEDCGLHPGDMEIFHFADEFEDVTRVYFSMANMVKPGTFPFDDMEGFSTPGLMLFAQLEGDPEDVTVLDEMIKTARRLASELGGEVLDDLRRPLTPAKEEAMHQAVLANERRWAKATRL